MKNQIQIFNNPNFGKVRVIGTGEQPLFCLADVCNVLDLTPSKVAQRLSDDVLSKYPIVDNIGREQQANFVNEDGLFDVILDSRKPEAKQFRKWVTGEVLPSIRKHGAYMTNDTLEKALTSPDFLIQLATQLKDEQQKRLQAEQEAAKLQIESKKLKDDNQYKQDVIQGLTDEISLADMRQRINQILRKGGVGGIDRYWHLLYQEFERKYHMNLSARKERSKYKSKMDYIDNELHMIPELYEVACKLFESSYNSLMRDWGRTVNTIRYDRKR